MNERADERELVKEMGDIMVSEAINVIKGLTLVDDDAVERIVNEIEPLHATYGEDVFGFFLNGINPDVFGSRASEELDVEKKGFLRKALIIFARKQMEQLTHFSDRPDNESTIVMELTDIKGRKVGEVEFMAHPQVVAFVERIGERYPYISSCILWHLLIGSSEVDSIEAPFFDIKGEDSIEKFIRSFEE